ncbi:hypothetical protein MAR_002658, partial [Mya arenaria]
MDVRLAFNGKAGKLNERVFKKLKAICQPVIAGQDNTRKGNARTLVSQGDVPLYDTRLVIRTVEKPWAGDLSDEEIENDLEQRILHYAIVPQVAYYRNEQTVSFVSPYFRWGSLEEVIQKEAAKTSENTTEKPAVEITENATQKPQNLGWKEKLRVLYQICCAIAYLHEPPNCDRKPVSHGNISMKSILLDERKNARLLYFAPTSDKGGVGEEQFQEDKNKDVQAFKDIAYEVFKHGRKKIASDIQKSVTMEEIKTTLMSLLRQSDIKWWTASSNMNTTKIKCDICCVNKPEMFYKKLQHDQSCVTKIQMCVGCLWNWRYNPVKCHSCDQGKIQSPVVKTSTTTHSEQLEKAFSNIDTPEINTLVLVYSGHHGEEGFRIDSDLLTDDALENKINGLKHVKKVILFLDCCFPKKLNLGDKTVLQFNAVKREQKASSGRTGSQFINEIVDALTKSWKCGCCQNSPIIRHFDLQEYLSRHANSDSTEPSHQTYTAGEIDVILTFRAVDSGWLTALEKSLESDPIQ